MKTEGDDAERRRPVLKEDVEKRRSRRKQIEQIREQLGIRFGIGPNYDDAKCYYILRTLTGVEVVCETLVEAAEYRFQEFRNILNETKECRAVIQAD